jgi:hypothetical protein
MSCPFLVLFGIVVYQGTDRGGGEFGPVIEEGKAHNAENFGDLGACLQEQFPGCGKGAPCGDKVVHEEYALALFDVIDVEFNFRIGIFKLVFFAQGSAGEFALFPYQDEGYAHAAGKGGGKKKAPGFYGRHGVNGLIFIKGNHSFYTITKSFRLDEYTGNVIEKNALLGKIRDFPDIPVKIKCFAHTNSPCSGSRNDARSGFTALGPLQNPAAIEKDLR